MPKIEKFKCDICQIFKHCGISIHWWILLQVVVWLYYKREERGDIWRGGCKSCHNNNGNFTHICLDNPFLPYNDETSNDYTLPKKSWVGNIRWVPTNQKPLPLLFMKWTANQTPSNPRIRRFDLLDSSSLFRNHAMGIQRHFWHFKM